MTAPGHSPPEPPKPWLTAAVDPPPPPPPPPDVAVKSSILNSEPVALAGTIQGLLIAVLAVLQGFNVTHLSQEQTSLLLALYLSVVAVTVAVARSRAWSPASVARLNNRKVD